MSQVSLRITVNEKCVAVYHSLQYYSQVTIIWWLHCKLTVTIALWRVTKWLHEFSLWLSSDLHLEIPLWSHYDRCIVVNRQITSQWNQMVTLMWLSFRDSTVKMSPWTLLSLWCHLVIRHKAPAESNELAVLSPNHCVMRGIRWLDFPVTSTGDSSLSPFLHCA